MVILADGCHIAIIRRGRTLAGMATKPRSVLASMIGWIIVALIAIWLFGIVIGWIRFVIRSIAWLVLIGLLVAAYVALKSDD